MAHAKLVRAAPTLASLNISATRKFYEEKLGFRAGHQEETFLEVSRDSVQIHFWRCSDPDIPKNTSCYVYVENINRLYEEYMTAGVVHPNGRLADQPYGMRDFAIVDSDGNLIRFGQSSSL